MNKILFRKNGLIPVDLHDPTYQQGVGGKMLSGIKQKNIFCEI